jgi:hypothetical protein
MEVRRFMGIAYRNGDGVSVEVWTGLITDEDAEKHIALVAGDPEWARQGRILTDLTGLVEESRPSDEGIAHTAALFRNRIGQRLRAAKWAMVADVTFEEATKFAEAISDEAPRLIVFNDPAAASDWLGVDVVQVGAILEDLRREAEGNGA